MRNRQGTVIFLSAVTLAGVLLLTVRAEQAKIQQRKDPMAEIAVEHDAAATLSVHQTAGKNPGIVEFIAEGADVRVSVPSGWERRETRGAALSMVTSDPPSLGFTRWHLPEGVTLSFRVEHSPALTIRHASIPPLLVVGKRVDLVSGKTEERSVLLKEGAARLW
ncbi:MAG: hypothetical protein HOO67_07625 [Candidatus Peribacteraceae bacterium]|nr:hypothetical protein [Candidatus Peribacteraceae bacterium]